MNHRLWQFVHNCIAHLAEGLAVLVCGFVPSWCDRFHEWTARKAWPT